MYNEHPNPEVMAAIIRLSDALCQWERMTGIESAFIIKEPKWSYRARSGKPNVPDWIKDDQFLEMIKNE